MTVLDDFTSGDIGRSLALLGSEERARLAERASVTNGKLQIRCLKRDRTVRATPEEIVRQLWLDRLLRQYGYPLGRLRVEEPIVIGRDATKKADIVITDAERQEALYAIIEVKQVKARDGKEQLRSYTNATGAPLAVWSRGAETIAWNRKDPNFFVEIPHFPSASQTIESVVNEP